MSALKEREREQSQKRCMVSGSLCPLLRFFDVSYLVSFVVRGSGPVGDDDLWYQHIVELVGAWSRLAGPWSLLEGPQSQLGGPGGGRKKKNEKK